MLFLARRWDLLALFFLTFPLPVREKRLAAPRLDFNFGILSILNLGT
jgi:hypothetical protein